MNMKEDIVTIVENLDPRAKKELEALGRDLVKLGVADIREASAADAYTKSPTSTPLPKQEQAVTQRL